MAAVDVDWKTYGVPLVAALVLLAWFFLIKPRLVDTDVAAPPTPSREPAAVTPGGQAAGEASEPN